jgi:uncharacterized protein YcbK (DUF882 family)
VARANNSPAEEYSIRLYNTHTREHIKVVYRQGSRYIPEGLAQLDRFLRDPLNGEFQHYDPRVFDLLSDLLRSSGHPDAELQVICGYRSAASNEYLRTHTSGVAKGSLHMRAEAIDVRLPGMKTLDLRNAALALGRGGVGYYPASDFVHVDVGKVRRW